MRLSLSLSAVVCLFHISKVNWHNAKQTQQWVKGEGLETWQVKG